MDALVVWERTKASAKKTPKAAISAQQPRASTTALPATFWASRRSPLPSAREIRALTPTPVPVPRPIRMFCAGKARLRAERQSSDTWAT